MLKSAVYPKKKKSNVTVELNIGPKSESALDDDMSHNYYYSNNNPRDNAYIIPSNLQISNEWNRFLI